MKHGIGSEVFLHPGEFHFGNAPGHIGTLLGSCVAITVWHPPHRFGGMCHCLLPNRPHPSAAPLDGRYADEAVAMFACELRIRGAQPGDCEVRLYGGGNMFSNVAADTAHIGRRNIHAAQRALARHGFVLTAAHVGGAFHRRLQFDLATGHVRLNLPGHPAVAQTA